MLKNQVFLKEIGEWKKKNKQPCKREHSILYC